MTIEKSQEQKDSVPAGKYEYFMVADFVIRTQSAIALPKNLKQAPQLPEIPGSITWKTDILPDDKLTAVAGLLATATTTVDLAHTEQLALKLAAGMHNIVGEVYHAVRFGNMMIKYFPKDQSDENKSEGA